MDNFYKFTGKIDQRKDGLYEMRTIDGKILVREVKKKQVKPTL